MTEQKLRSLSESFLAARDVYEETFHDLQTAIQEYLETHDSLPEGVEDVR